MGVTGKIKNGVVVLPRGTKLPEGADVRVETLDLLPESDPRIAAILKLAKPRPHWPKDFSINHAHFDSHMKAVTQTKRQGAKEQRRNQKKTTNVSDFTELVCQVTAK